MTPFEDYGPDEAEQLEQMAHQYLFAVVHAANQVSELALTLLGKAPKDNLSLRASLDEIDTMSRDLRDKAESAWLEHGGAT